MIKYIDLFAGIGGIRLGFEQALGNLGIEGRCVLSSEIDKKACETYKINFNETPKGDIRLIDEIEGFDFLLAGFPCQPFSYAGRKQGFGDTRGTLFFEVERILKRHRPKGLLLENVRGFTTHDHGRTFETVINCLIELGYNVETLILNSCNFGVPQYRVRVYILGLLKKKPKLTIYSDNGPADSHKFKSKQTSFNFSKYKRKKILVRDVIEENVDHKYQCSDELNSKLKQLYGSDLRKLSGFRFIDYRGGNSIHSWELGLKGKCTKDEIKFMNTLIANRRKKVFGSHQDGKMLNITQMKTFYHENNIEDTIASLVAKGYLKNNNGKYNPVCGNMSFEIYKILDPDSISVTVVSSDANRLGIIKKNRLRRLTPRECARLQGFPEEYILNPDDNAAYKQIGNAVSVPVIRTIATDFFENNNIY